jgi:hypothetical protein
MTTALITPPADVQSAVPALISVCRQWQPTALPATPPALPLVPPAPASPDAEICALVQHPAAQFWEATAVLVLLVMAVIALRWVLWRRALRLGRRVAQ